jgi:serine kinase of HPr protein (carbohydrate metabolism regulator)
MEFAEPSEALFIGGRSGVGKSTVALEVSHLLAEARVQHAVIEGDNLDLAYPEPWRHGLQLAELNLAAMWHTYRAAGYRRLVYTNTVSVLESKKLAHAMGGEVRITAVLLTASDETTHSRLSIREVGSTLEQHVERSNQAARDLEARALSSVHRVVTDGRRLTEIAHQVIALTGWLN